MSNVIVKYCTWSLTNRLERCVKAEGRGKMPNIPHRETMTENQRDEAVRW